MGKIRDEIEKLNNQLKIMQINKQDKSIGSDIARLEKLIINLAERVDNLKLK